MFKGKFSRKVYGDPLKAVNKGIQEGNVRLGLAVAGQAALFAPVDFGQLRNSISVASRLRTGIGLNTLPGEKAPPLDNSGLKGFDAFVGTNVEHAVYQEYGTRKMAAQPFMRPAVALIVDNKTAEEVLEKYQAKAMDRELKRVHK